MCAAPRRAAPRRAAPERQMRTCGSAVNSDRLTFTAHTNLLRAAKFNASSVEALYMASTHTRIRTYACKLASKRTL